MIPFQHWSYSKLQTYLRCPALFRFRYIEEAVPESTSMALLLGSAIHGAVTLLHSKAFQGHSVELEPVLDTFRAQLTASVDKAERHVSYPKVSPDLRSNIELGERMLSCYFESQGAGKTVALEQELRAPLQKRGGGETSLPLLGYVDRIGETDGTLVVIELKTSARSWSQADVDLSSQISSYALLMKDAGYEDCRYRYEILTKTKDSKLQILETRRTERDMDRLVDQFLHLEGAVEAGVFPRNESSMNCMGCEFRKRCDASA